MTQAIRTNGNNEVIIWMKHPIVRIGLPIGALITIAITLSGWIFNAGGSKRSYDDTVGKVPVLETKVNTLEIKVTGLEHDQRSMAIELSICHGLMNEMANTLKTVENNQGKVLTDLGWIKGKILK